MVNQNLKLNPRLFDLFQHCELKCNAGCCGWDAFDFTKSWVGRWCESRELTQVQGARQEIQQVIEKLDGYDPQSKIAIQEFFTPQLGTFTEQLRQVDGLLASCAPNSNTDSA